MKNVFYIFLSAVAGLLAGCSSDSNPLAEYEGGRPFSILKITQSYSPDIQWVGGRVAAVGVNRGTKAALDSTLVWLQTAGGDEISSYVTVGQQSDEARIRQYGGTPLDSLASSQDYTFWIATKEAMDGGLNGATQSEETFKDTTFTVNYQIRGTLRTQENVTVTVYRDQRLLSDRLIVKWSPASFKFRQIVLRDNSQPGWTDLLWHVRTPPGTPADLTSPVSTDITPAGAEIVQAWPESGIVQKVYTLWMTADNWDNTFSLRSNGLAYIVFISSSIQN